jgi:multicomponent Na+:H+ antiporter subunit E
MAVPRAILLLLLLLGIWLLWSGIWVPLIIGFGVLSCVVVVLLCVRMGSIDAEGAPLQVAGRVLLYVPWLVKEIVVSSLDVTKRVLDPKLPISPTLIDVPSTQKTDLARTIFANSITLTPGTVSYALEDGHIKVHAIAQEVADGLLNGEMDRRCAAIEGRG